MFDKESFPTNKKNYNKYIHHSENITWIILYLLSSKKYSWNEKTVLDTLLIDKNDYFAIFNFFLMLNINKLEFLQRDELLRNANEISKNSNNKKVERVLHNFDWILNIFII